MKMIHLADLHLGKRLNEFSLIEDQKYILDRIIEIVMEERADSVLISGDVYDKSIASTEAVTLLDSFLVELSKLVKAVFVISGNHDSSQRLGFASYLIDKSGVHISPVFGPNMPSFSLGDEFGEVCFYMLPFIRPANVREVYPDETIESYTDAVKVAIEKMNVDDKRRNVILSHQFVTGALTSGSEDISVGGTDNIPASVYSKFDYVALGHIHNAQDIDADNIVRYPGTPLKYSFSEKSPRTLTVVGLKEKGNVTYKTVELKPLRDMVELKGTYSDLMDKSYSEYERFTSDFVHITLTDEEDVIDAVSRLRTRYTNLMKLDYDNTRTRSSNQIVSIEDIEEKQPIDMFSDLFEKQNGKKMSEAQTKIVDELIKKIWRNE